MNMISPGIKIFVLPGGKMPERKTDEAIGYDASLRAIVSSTQMDEQNPTLRKTLFDFETMPDNPEVAEYVQEDREGDLFYRLEPGKWAVGGIGFCCQMPFPMFYWVAPRSGLASKWGITVANAPGTVDPDYRGEAGVVIVNTSQKSFRLTKDMRIAQVIFQWALIPTIEEVSRHSELSATERNAGGFGSTGLR